MLECDYPALSGIEWVFMTERYEKMVNGKKYFTVKPKTDFSCTGCIAYSNVQLCNNLAPNGECSNIIWRKAKKEKISRVSIFDMDGVLVDSSHRYKTLTKPDGTIAIDLDHWRENEHLAMQDKPGPMFDQYRRELADKNTFVIIATARQLNGPDWQYIREILGEPDFIIWRKHGDEQSGKTLKANGLAKFFNLISFKGSEFVFYEDNIHYLKYVCDRFNIRGVYIPSVQGH